MEAIGENVFLCFTVEVDDHRREPVATFHCLGIEGDRFLIDGCSGLGALVDLDFVERDDLLGHVVSSGVLGKGQVELDCQARQVFEFDNGDPWLPIRAMAYERDVLAGVSFSLLQGIVEPESSGTRANQDGTAKLVETVETV